MQGPQKKRRKPQQEHDGVAAEQGRQQGGGGTPVAGGLLAQKAQREAQRAKTPPPEPSPQQGPATRPAAMKQEQVGVETPLSRSPLDAARIRESLGLPARGEGHEVRESPSRAKARSWGHWDCNAWVLLLWSLTVEGSGRALGCQHEVSDAFVTKGTIERSHRERTLRASAGPSDKGMQRRGVWLGGKLLWLPAAAVCSAGPAAARAAAALLATSLKDAESSGGEEMEEEEEEVEKVPGKPGPRRKRGPVTKPCAAARVSETIRRDVRAQE